MSLLLTLDKRMNEPGKEANSAMDEQLQRDITHLLSQLESLHEGRNSRQERPAAEEGTLPLHEQQAQQPPIIVYLMDAPLAEETDNDSYNQDAYADTVESLPETEEEGETTTAGEAATVPPPLMQAERPPTTLSPRRQRRSRVRPLDVLPCVLFLLGALLVSSLVLPLFLVSATVTIIPLSHEITTTTTVSVVTDGKADPHEQQIPGRVLSSLTLSQARSVATTGIGFQPATAAHGTITLYNALPAVQTVPAGELLTGSDGVQVVTDEDALIPAGSLSTNGQVTVLAHAVQAGPAGNIRAGDIYGACCRANVFAQNAAFTGGQNARSFSMVTRADLNGAVTGVETSLMQSVQAALAAQVHADETLVTPTCTPTITPSSAIGDEAAHLSVTVDETCRGEVYRTQALHDLVTQAVTETATKQVGTGYSLSGNVETTAVQSSTSKGHRRGSSLTLRVRGVGVWIYRFTLEQLHHLAQRIAGKSIKDAKAMVLAVPGVQSVTIQLNGGEKSDSSTLPRDPGQIKLGQLMEFGL